MKFKLKQILNAEKNVNTNEVCLLRFLFDRFLSFPPFKLSWQRLMADVQTCIHCNQKVLSKYSNIEIGYLRS